MGKCFDTISGQRSSCSTEFVNLVVVVAKRVVATISFNPYKYSRVNVREEVSTSNDKESEADAKLDSIRSKAKKMILEIPGRIKNCIETPDNSDAGFHIPKKGV